MHRNLCFNKVTSLRPLLNKKLRHRCFPVNFVKVLRKFYRAIPDDCFSRSFKNSCSVGLTDIENTSLIKHQQNCKKILAISAMGNFSRQFISFVVLFPRIFSRHYEHTFSGTSVRFCYSFSSFTAMSLLNYVPYAL